MSAHAILSCSSSARWLTCTPSARLEATFPSTTNTAAEEGTLAHELGCLFLQKELKLVKKNVYEKKLKEIQANELYNEEMDDHADAYSTFVMERYAEALSHTKDALIFLEQKLNLTDYVPEGFGTGDTVIIADHTLDIIDLKYGKGVLVKADNNKQMMLYALGALREFDFMYDIKEVRMTIYQPRIDNFSSYIVTVDELTSWAEDVLRPRAAMAFKGEGEFVAGDHCRFCKVAGACKANAAMNLQLAKYEFRDPEYLLSDEEIADILDKQDQFCKWLDAVDAYALDQAVNHSKEWPGYKIVEGKARRKYTDTIAIRETLVKKGFEEDTIAPRTLLGVTLLTKEIGKKTFEAVVDPFIIKPPGKLTLVPVTDKRPAYNSLDAARKDFETDLSTT